MRAALFTALAVCLALCGASAAEGGRQLYVNPAVGSDSADGLAAESHGGSGPVKTIARGLKLALPGDTVHLAQATYRESAHFHQRFGEAGRPITLDGHGAVLEGSEPLDPATWQEISPGLYRCDNLLPLNGAILIRWFFLFDGTMQRMGRSCKAPSAALKAPEALAPGEWTFVVDLQRTAAATGSGDGRAQFGAFYLRTAPGKALAESNIAAPIRSSGVAFSGKNGHIVVRNVTTQHFHNDGFNIHGEATDLHFENIRALHCGDDGFSAHETCQCFVDGFVSIGNGTGLCDVNSSETHYRRVYIADAVGYDISFFNSGRHSVRDAFVRSAANVAISINGEARSDGMNAVELENVWIERPGDQPNKVSISSGTETKLLGCTFKNLSLQVTAGHVHLERSAVFGGNSVKPEITIWTAVQWEADRNWYDIQHLRVGPELYSPAKFAAYQAASNQDTASAVAPQALPAEVGANLRRLTEALAPLGIALPAR